ncbi:hypothetical protein ACFFWD_13015 [Bradyrhizobium erythrophlei]
MTLPVFRDDLRRRMPEDDQGQLRVVHRDRSIGRNLARRRPEEQIAAGRVAHRIAGHQLRLDLAARILDLQARRIDLRARSASGRDGAADPRDRLPSAQHSPDGVGLLDIAAGRVKVDRALRVLDAGQEAADPRRRIAIDLALDGNPAIAACPA